ncbi:mobile element protein [Geminocystis sp. NIES-3708]|nr:mobile element protein [Geminocystis sp. NIES-3708]
MLIIDEADRLKPKTFADVRDIYDLGIAVVLVGTERLDTVIKKDEQVYNRFRACYSFGTLTGNSLIKVVEIWEKQVLCLPLPSNLAQKSMMQVIAQSTRGYIGLIDMILKEAAIRTLQKGNKKIDLNTLKEVAQEYK